MLRLMRASFRWFQRWQLSLFEKLLLVNSLLLITETVVGLWITSHNLEAHHYLIDTAFIILATLLTLVVNMLVLRANLQPLFQLLHTIREVSAGQTGARAVAVSPYNEIGELALTFNSMLDSLDQARRSQAIIILQAQEEERRRLALELHDETGQNLTALLVHTEVLQQQVQQLLEEHPAHASTERLAQGMSQLTLLTQRTLENIRILSQQLRPSVLDDLGLLPALRWLAEDYALRFPLRIDFQAEALSELLPILPATYETALFRLAQEGLTNVARHAHAQRVWLSLRFDAGRQVICLRIEDDGHGYQPEQVTKGIGILGMQERAQLLKGKLTIESKEGEGTTVLVELPFVRRQQKGKEEDHAS